MLKPILDEYLKNKKKEQEDEEEREFLEKYLKSKVYSLSFSIISINNGFQAHFEWLSD
jgi:hypothetical protein